MLYESYSNLCMLHVPHEMAELAFNSSHRYSTNDLSRTIKDEYNYLLSAIRHNPRTYDNKSCAAMIPSTSSWTYIDCTRQFVDVAFLCQYMPDSSVRPLKGWCVDTSRDSYCKNGWVWGYEVCMKLQYIAKKHITKEEMYSACRKIGGITQHGRIETIDNFFNLVMSYLGLSYAIFLRNNNTVNLYASAQSISSTYRATIMSEMTIPLIFEEEKQVAILCFKQPLPIKESCEDGYMPCNNGECMPETYFCDSKLHCSDGSDEYNCTNYCSHKTNSNLYFQCKNSLCIPIS